MASTGGQTMRRTGSGLSCIVRVSTLAVRLARQRLAGTWRQQDRAVRRKVPVAARRKDVWRSAAAVHWLLAAPFDRPAAIGWRRQERLGNRMAMQIGADVHEQHAIVGVVVREEAQGERPRREHGTVEAVL